MTFLNPFALFGLLAAVIPLVLHLFNLRKLQTIEFSTLSFLKELQKTKIRRLKLRQLLLLLLRTLLVLLLVIAFSRPTLKGSISGGLAERAKTTAVLLIDDSFSMTASDQHGDLLRQAKSCAHEIINLLKDGDEVYFLKFSDCAHQSFLPNAQRNFSVVRSLINDIQPSALHRPLIDALKIASRIIASSKNFNKEIYILSDFQTGIFENTSLKQQALFPNTVHVFVFPIGNRELQNVAVGAITIPNAIFEIGKPFTVRATIINYGSSRISNHVVSVFQDGTRVTEKSIDIDAGKRIETDFSLVPQHSGYVEGIVMLEDDDLEFDNRHYFTTYIPDQLHVCLAGTPNDIRYVKLALSAKLLDSTTNIKLTETSPDRLSSSILNASDVLVLTSIQGLTQPRSAQITAFIKNGGGIFFFPSLQLDITAYNTLFAKPLSVTECANIERLQSGSGQESFIEFDKVDRRHPIFQGMFEEQTAAMKGMDARHVQIESPKILTYVRFVPTSRSQIIISLSNGMPFLTEDRVGNGRLLSMCVAPTTDWSNLPLKGLFVPIVHRGVAYLSHSVSANETLCCGDEITLPLRQQGNQHLRIKRPDKKEIIVNAMYAGDRTVVKFSETTVPGIYTLTSDNTDIQKFAVNIDPLESTPAPASKKMIEKFFDQVGISQSNMNTITQPQEVQHIVMESRLGTELWKHMLALALLVGIIEMLIARDSKKDLASLYRDV